MQIFPSKGDNGDSRNNKKERTVPVVPQIQIDLFIIYISNSQ